MKEKDGIRKGRKRREAAHEKWRRKSFDERKSNEIRTAAYSVQCRHDDDDDEVDEHEDGKG